jgi:hypothetical protein
MQFQDDKDIFGRMLVLTDNPLFNNLRNAVDNFDADLTDALSWGQLKSKRWLVDELEKSNLDLGTVFLCAGWYATLAAMIFDSNVNVFKIRSFDIDDACASIAETVNRHHTKDNWRFKASTANIHDINYRGFTYKSKRYDGSEVELSDAPDTIINTSCEHIENFSNWYNNIPTGKIVILQNNNYTEIDDHINCVNNLEEFANQTSMSQVLYEGSLKLSKYTRFMRIGIK